MRTGDLVSGLVRRFAGDTVIVTLGPGVEAVLPESQRVRGESHRIGDRVRGIVLEVHDTGPLCKVVLSRVHRDFVRRLFELEVPEIANATITIRAIEREPGARTKVGLHAADPDLDCVGVSGMRVDAIRAELRGEQIDIFRWQTGDEALIREALKPARVETIELRPADKRAVVLVANDQLSVVIGRKGQNLRLASKLTGWDLDVLTRDQWPER